MQQLNKNIYKKEFVETFKGDDTGNLKARQTPGVLYSKAVPTPVNNPQLLAWSEDLASELEIMKPTTQQEIDILGGNYIVPSMYPYAACYAGHQFGNWAGQLGDGRAITLGEWDVRNATWELQLKGAGPTPYSRRADGRAVLRSSVREYLMSEAMHYLGVPTTRALSLVSTGDQVLRDMFYNGNAEYEPGAIVMRVAPSFLRFGNFEMLAAREETENLKQLVNWTINKFYPHISGDGEEKIIAWFKEIVERTAQLMVEWLRVGFVHGVMNTDNMSILGLTIDYGPYSFLDDYDPDFTPNTTDLPGRRYAYGRQPSIGYWNLGCLANALVPLFSGTELLSAALESYQDKYWAKYYAMKGRKLGIDKVMKEDIELIDNFEKMLATLKPDMTIFYQLLIDFPVEQKLEGSEIIGVFNDSFYGELPEGHAKYLIETMLSYQERLKITEVSERKNLMRQNNPRFILRNYMLHNAIQELENGENSLFLKLQEAMKTPYSKNHDEFFIKRPEWATQKAGCSMLSCSS